MSTPEQPQFVEHLRQRLVVQQRRRFFAHRLVIGILACGSVYAQADVSSSADELLATVFADGSGLPVGQGTAREGESLYRDQCAACHGGSGEGGSAVELVGDRATLGTEWPDRGIAVLWPYAPPLFDYVRRAMPPNAPYSLSVDETYAVVARVLELNALVESDEMVDANFLSSLVMPNVDGFKTADE